VGVQTVSARRGYFTVNRDFWESWCGILTPHEMCVYLSLLSDSDQKRTSWHSGVNIAKRLNISRHAVVNALRELEVQRLLKKRVRERRGPLKLYEYILSPQSAKPRKCLQPVNHSQPNCSPDVL